MIGWSCVEELRQEIGPADFEDVVEMFLEEVEEVIGRLHGPQNPCQLEQDLHFLKGSALYLGFEAFSTLCQEGEQAAAAGSAEAVDLGRIVTCYRQSKTRFQAEYSARFAD